MGRRIVFTTAVGSMPDYFRTWAMRRVLRFSLPMPALGLRFIGANFPEIEILEYPSWNRFERTLNEGVDILGISFFMMDGNVVLKMLEMARKHGVREIWGGGYGVLCEEIAEKFDRIFIGYSEDEISRAIRGEPLDKLTHPAIPTTFGFNGTPFRTVQGFLFTTRGCPYRCDFCQTPAFVDRASAISLDVVEDVLIEYKRMGISVLFVAEENFLGMRQHGNRVVDLLSDYGFLWAPQTRIDNIANRVADLRDAGMFNVMFGIDSFNQDNLDSMHKHSTTDKIMDVISEMGDNNIYMHANYILGYEHDTEKSVRADLKKLEALDIQSTQITIMTPFPHTPLHDVINERYGIFEKDYSKFDTYHLTWNHPNLTKKRLESLLLEGIHKCNNPGRMLEGYRKIRTNNLTRKFASSGPLGIRLKHWMGIYR